MLSPVWSSAAGGAAAGVRRCDGDCDVTTYLPEVLAKRGGAEAEIQAALRKLESLRQFIQTIPIALFEPLESQARERL